MVTWLAHALCDEALVDAAENECCTVEVIVKEEGKFEVVSFKTAEGWS